MSAASICFVSRGYLGKEESGRTIRTVTVRVKAHERGVEAVCTLACWKADTGKVEILLLIVSFGWYEVVV
jgi:hypothetical protein